MLDLGPQDNSRVKVALTTLPGANRGSSPTTDKSRMVTFSSQPTLTTGTSRRGKAPSVDPFIGEGQEFVLDDWLPSLERGAVNNN